MPKIGLEMLKHGDKIVLALVKGIVGSLIANRVGLFNALVNTITYAVDGIKGIISSNPYQIGKDMINGFVGGIQSAAGGIWASLHKTFTDLLKKIKDFFGIKSPSKVFYGFGEFMMQGMTNGIAAASIDMVKTLGSVSNEAANLVMKAAQVTGKAASDFIEDAGNTLKAGAGIAAAAGAGLVNTVGAGISTAGNAIVSGAQNIGNTIASGIGRLRFAVGADSLPSDMTARVHQGERITPRTQNQELMAGSMMMLAPKALASILSGAGAGLGSRVIQIHNVMTGTMDVDGRSIGRVAFENLDRMAVQV
jgi:hypothetical protein